METPKVFGKYAPKKYQLGNRGWVEEENEEGVKHPQEVQLPQLPPPPIPTQPQHQHQPPPHLLLCPPGPTPHQHQHQPPHLLLCPPAPAEAESVPKVFGKYAPKKYQLGNRGWVEEEQEVVHHPHLLHPLAPSPIQQLPDDWMFTDDKINNQETQTEEKLWMNLYLSVCSI